jgi:hypothetical protein
MRQGRLLFILKLIGDLQAIVQQRQLLAAGAVIFQSGQPQLNAFVGLLQLLILLQRLRRRLNHVQPGEVRQRPGVVFHLVGEGIKDLALLYRLAFDAVGAGGHEHGAPGCQRQADGDPVSPVGDGGDSHPVFPCMQMKLF